MSEHHENVPQLMSYAAIASKLGKSPTTIKRWARESKNDFPAPHYIDTSAVFYEHEVNDWLNSVITLSPKTAKQHAEPCLSARGLANTE
jgi:predicted DNA-binding transcriptional regulator AlpA